MKNTSDYTLLSGTSAIYIDGTFVGKTGFPTLGPEEDFTCAVGYVSAHFSAYDHLIIFGRHRIDPSIRVIYHKHSKKTSQTGLITKSSVTSFTQRITIQNKKSIPLTALRVVDHIPVSDDPDITIKLLQPALPSVPASTASPPPQPGATAKLSEKDIEKLSLHQGPEVEVASGVTAHWYIGEDAGEGQGKLLGSDGAILWTCRIPEQGKIELVLAWEVIAPASARVRGLEYH